MCFLTFFFVTRHVPVDHTLLPMYVYIYGRYVTYVKDWIMYGTFVHMIPDEITVVHLRFNK